MQSAKFAGLARQRVGSPRPRMCDADCTLHSRCAGLRCTPVAAKAGAPSRNHAAASAFCGKVFLRGQTGSLCSEVLLLLLGIPPVGQGGGRDALEGEGPQRQSQKGLDRWSEEVAKAVSGGYCRLQMPLKLALGVRETVAGRRLSALQGVVGGVSAPGGLPRGPPPMRGGRKGQGGGLVRRGVRPGRFHRPLPAVCPPRARFPRGGDRLRDGPAVRWRSALAFAFCPSRPPDSFV